ncbi:terminase small subunit [Pseudomonas graminis]|uniref:terminase small subunit n=1 Tax=Pseudomonas graminis TaxID=158627 RepID=UPI0009F473EA
MALTPKKRAFADALRGGASNKEAAIAAGYSASSASAAGSRLAKDPHVLAELANGTVNKNVKAQPKAKAPKSVESDVDDEDSGPTFDLARALTFTDPKAYLIAAMNDPESADDWLDWRYQRIGKPGRRIGAGGQLQGIRLRPERHHFPLVQRAIRLRRSSVH